MSLLDCVVRDDGCTECPYIPHIPATPPHLEISALPGWNAGANSVSILPDDLHTIFQLAGLSSSITLGFRSTRDRQWIPELIEYGLLFQIVAGLSFVSVVEFGTTQVLNAPCVLSDSFEIRRRGGTVTYWQNGDLLYQSTRRSTPSLQLNCCLYIAGDAVA